MDPIYALATPFRANELKSSSKKLLEQPPSYDRGAIESMWRHCSRNRMRTHRRRPLVLSDLSSKATVRNDLCTENGVLAPKQSRIDVSESIDETAAATSDTKCDSVLESGNNDVTERKHSDSDDDYSSNSLNGNFDASASALENLSSGPAEYYDSGVQAKSEDTSHTADGSLKVEDGWWNKVDSHTWLQGLQSYLLLHSAVDSRLHPVPVAVLAPNPTPYTVIANAASHRQAVPSAAAESAVIETTNLWTEHQYAARPVLAPVAGYRVLTNGVLSPVPVYYLPVVNHSACGLAPGASAVSSEHTYIGGQQSSLTAVDLVSFMHNYCLPPTSNTQSSANLSVVQITPNAADQRFVGSEVTSSNERPGSLPMTEHAASDERSISNACQQMENSYLSSCPMSSVLSATEAAAFSLSSSSVCLTPRSLSSNSSAESWTDDVSEVTASCSSVAVNSDDITSGSLFPADADLTIPGWFGKGLGIRRSKRRLSRQS